MDRNQEVAKTPRDKDTIVPGATQVLKEVGT